MGDPRMVAAVTPADALAILRGAVALRDPTCDKHREELAALGELARVVALMESATEIGFARGSMIVRQRDGQWSAYGPSGSSLTARFPSAMDARAAIVRGG